MIATAVTCCGLVHEQGVKGCLERYLSHIIVLMNSIWLKLASQEASCCDKVGNIAGGCCCCAISQIVERGTNECSRLFGMFHRLVSGVFCGKRRGGQRDEKSLGRLETVRVLCVKRVLSQRLVTEPGLSKSQSQIACEFMGMLAGAGTLVCADLAGCSTLTASLEWTAASFTAASTPNQSQIVLL